MSMKKTDLEKNKALKLREDMQKAPIPSRFGTASTAVPDRREQRRLDQAAGLVPFAVKLRDELVARLRAQAEQEGVSLNELTERVIRAGLGEELARPAAKQTTAPKPAQAKKPASAKAEPDQAPAKKAPAKKVPAKKAAAKKAVKPKA